jgi:GTP-binding protein EngB required for normal cell division
MTPTGFFYGAVCLECLTKNPQIVVNTKRPPLGYRLGQATMTQDSRASLNPNQQRRLRVTCQYVDKTLADAEAILSASTVKSAFQKYIPDLLPAQRRVIEDYIGRIRAQLLRVLKGQGLDPEPPSIPVSRALHATLTFVDIAAEELKPKYMRGYGEVSEAAAAELNGIAGELQGVVHKLDRFVAQEEAHDLTQRLQRLERAGKEVSTLQLLERIIGERGLVEFRPTLQMLLGRLEDNSFEIAVFGRVSSGKSSLLDKVLETDVLPVGVTPITAVPTRIMYGEQASVAVWFAEKPAERHPIERLAEFVAEDSNPGNSKHITRIVVQLPARRLHQGVVFVDTPGLGSLATRGAAETLAYLPRCDLGVVLIDAASALTPNDLQTIQTLYEAGIPANVLLSKADLPTSGDRARLLSYVQTQISSELGLDLTVRPISVVGGFDDLVNDWFRAEIQPLYASHQQMRTASLQRKVGGLKRSVEAALMARLRRDGSDAGEPVIGEAEERLRLATARIVEAENANGRSADDLARARSIVLHEAAVALLEAWTASPDGVDAKNVVHNQLRVLAHERGLALREQLVSLGRELAASLAQAGALLRLANVPDDNELVGLVREMPILDPGPLAVDVQRPSLATLLGRGVTQARIEHKLTARMGSAVSQLLADYGRVLQSWARRILSEMRQRFESYADTYRAQAARVVAGSDLSSEEQKAIRDDLERLRGPEAEKSAGLSHSSNIGEERIQIA